MKALLFEGNEINVESSNRFIFVNGEDKAYAFLVVIALICLSLLSYSYLLEILSVIFGAYIPVMFIRSFSQVRTLVDFEMMNLEREYNLFGIKVFKLQNPFSSINLSLEKTLRGGHNSSYALLSSGFHSRKQKK